MSRFIRPNVRKFSLQGIVATLRTVKVLRAIGKGLWTMRGPLGLCAAPLAAWGLVSLLQTIACTPGELAQVAADVPIAAQDVACVLEGHQPAGSFEQEAEQDAALLAKCLVPAAQGATVLHIVHASILAAQGQRLLSELDAASQVVSMVHALQAMAGAGDGASAAVQDVRAGP